MKTKFNIKTFLFLHAVIFLYALSSICSKYASSLAFFSFKWMLIYALQIFILGCYALLWQQVLKRMPLNFAFANKSVTLIWGMIFGVIIFEETLSVLNIVGAIIVLVGVVFMVTENRDKVSSGKSISYEEVACESEVKSEGENE